MPAFNHVACLLVTCCTCTFGLANAGQAADPITEFDIPNSTGRPQGMAAGPDGNLWVTLTGGSKVVRITPDGKITDFAVPVPKGHLLQGITAGPDGNVWFTSPTDNTIRRISPKGELNGDFKIPTKTKVPMARRLLLRARESQAALMETSGSPNWGVTRSAGSLPRATSTNSRCQPRIAAHIIPRLTRTARSGSAK